MPLLTATRRQGALLHASRLFRAPVARGIAGEKPVDREGGDFGAGLIRGAAVIARGEAGGHRLWVDRVMLEQTRDIINAAPRGIKGRFQHPGVSGDGLGRSLGRWKNAAIDGDVTRADLHLYETAHRTPDGDLAGYVMDLAEEDPAAFGVSISFDPDIEAEDAFVSEHHERGRFKSPDTDNANSYPHARIGRLKAADAVDDPAANPDGLFSRESGLVDVGDRLLRYALKLTDAAPEALEVGVAPERVRDWMQRFLQAEGLSVVPLWKLEHYQKWVADLTRTK